MTFGAICLVASAFGATANAATASAATAGKCSGTPITFGAILNLVSNNPAVPGNTKAAAPEIAATKAVNRDCTAGVPMKLTVCDSKGDPNTASECARQGVEEKWVGWIGDGVSGAQTFPILSEAGIPEFGGFGFSAPELTSKMWFPYGGNVSNVLSLVTIASFANSPEPAKVSVAVLDSPAAATLTTLFKTGVEKAGGEYTGTVAVPASATDMSQYAAQATGSGANAVATALAGDQYSGMLQQLVQQGEDFEKLAIIGVAGATTQNDIDNLGPAVKGIWGNHYTLVIDRKNPGVKQYVKELKAAKLPVKDSADNKVFIDGSFEAWNFVHLVAELLADAPTKDAATLVEKLNTVGPIQRDGMPTVDFAVNPFADDPLLGLVRITSNEFAATRLDAKGKEVLVTDGFVTIGEEFKPKKVG
jgi:ABC-type branched-subunit amino acid transport system substrate-binding protein